MSAAMALHVQLSLRLDAVEAYRLAHAYRDEVRRGDAARLLDESREHAGRALFCDGIRHAASRLNEWAENQKQDSPAPDFFQPGHTYADTNAAGYDWKFRVDTVTTHPEDGERTALGWRFFRGQWGAIAYGEDDWEIHQLAGLTDVTEERAR